MHQEWLRRKLSIEEAEAAYAVRNPRLGPEPVPFGFLHHQWEALRARMQPGDELWEFGSPPESWARLAGRSGVALVRDGRILDEIVTTMS